MFISEEIFFIFIVTNTNSFIMKLPYVFKRNLFSIYIQISAFHIYAIAWKTYYPLYIIYPIFRWVILIVRIGEYYHVPTVYVINWENNFIRKRYPCTIYKLIYKQVVTYKQCGNH